MVVHILIAPSGWSIHRVERDLVLCAFVVQLDVPPLAAVCRDAKATNEGDSRGSST